MRLKPWQVLLAVFSGKLAVLSWLWWHRVPHYGADAIQLRQPAIELLRSGKFLLTTIWGVIPHSETFFAAYPPGYALFNAAVMMLGGTRLSVFLAQDLLTHALITLGIVFWAFRNGAGIARSALLVAASFAIILPLGRPEEFGILLFLSAVALASAENRWASYFTFIPLGYALATGPATGVLASGFVCLFWLYLHGVSRSTLRITFIQMALAGVIAAVTWGSIAVGHFDQVVEQFRMFRKASYQAGPLNLVIGAPGLTLMVLLSIAGCIWAVPRAINSPSLERSTAALLKTARIALPASVLLNLLLVRPEYDYRLLALVGPAVFAVALAHLPSAPARSRFEWAGAFVFLGAALLHSVPLIRFGVSPLAQPAGSSHYEDVFDRITQVIPEGASVGGDGAFFALNSRQSNYADLNISAEDHWPQFVISSTWTDPPYVLQRGRWQKKLERDYVEVPDVGHSYSPGCKLNVGPLHLPVARGTCEWNVRVWRRTDVNPGS